MTAVADRQGWNIDTVLVGTAGMGLTFGMWWLYDLVPSAEVLNRHRDRAWAWSLLQMLIVTSIVATGAGLRVAADFIGHKTRMTDAATVLAVAVPVSIFLLLLHALYSYLVRRFRPFEAALLFTSSAVAMLAVVAALSGIRLTVCLLILMLAPAVTVIGYEVKGYRHPATGPEVNVLDGHA